MGEDLKLFGEVGLGYGQLQQDAEAINKLLNDIDKQAKALGNAFKDNKLNINSKQSEQDLKKMYDELVKITAGNQQVSNSMRNLTSDVNELNKYIDKNVDTFKKASDALSKMDMGTAGIDKQTQDLSKFIDKQRQELTKWAKERTSLVKELNLKDLSQMALDDYKTNSKSGSAVEKAESLRRLGQAMSVVNYQIEQNKSAMKSIEDNYNKASKAIRTFKESNDKIISQGEFDGIKNLASKSDYAISYKESMLKSGITQVMAKYRNDAQNEITQIFHILKDGNVKIISTTTETGKASANALKKQLSDIKKEQRQLETQAGKMDKAINFSGSDKSVKGTTKSLGILLGQAYAIKRAFGYINKEIMTFEKNAVEVQRIAGYTKKEMDALADATFDMGKNMGLNVNTIQEIEGLWARAGKGGQALVEATKTTALGFNVAEFKDAESAVASMNSIINQMYNGDATKAPEILDALTKVADKTAVRNVNDLVEVVSRAGANAKSLGMDLHELNAASSVVMERMKLTGDVLGTQFKTIFAYMADGKRIEKLKQYGVEFTNINKDGTESLKPFMEMMDNLVAKYQELKSQGKDVMANDMIKNLSGVRNVATLKNLVEGWSSMRERILLSQNSKGFAERQNAKMMETYAKKVEQLKVAFQELAVSIGNNGFLDLLKNIADGTRVSIEFFSKYNKEILTVVGTIGLFKTAMMGLSGIQKVFGSNGLGGLFRLLTSNGYSKKFKVGATLSTLSGTEFLVKKEDIKEAFDSFDAMKQKAKETISPVSSLSVAMANLKGNAMAMKTAMSGTAGIIGGITLAIGALATAYYVYRQKRINILEDFTSGKADEAINNIRELKKELDDITKTNAYKKGDSNALDAYKSTTEELARVLGIAHSVTVGNKESMDLYNESLRVAVELKEKEYELNNKIAISEAKKSIHDLVKPTVDSAGGLGTSKMPTGASKLTQSVERYLIALKNVKDLRKKINNGDNPAGMLKKLDDAMIEQTKKELELTEKLQTLKQNQAISGTTDDELKKMLDGQSYNGKPIIDFIDAFLAKTPDVKDAIGDIGDKASDTKDEIEEMAKTIQELVDEFNNLTNKTDAMDTAFQEIYDTGHISNGTVMKLLSADNEMAQYLVKTKDGYTLLSGALEHYNEQQDEANKTTDEAINKLREKYDMETDVSGNPIAKATNPDDVSKNIELMVNDITKGVDKVKATFEGGTTSVKEFLDKIKNAKDDADLSNLLSGLDTSQIEALNGELANQLQQSMNNIHNQFNAGLIDIGDYAGALNAAKGEALELYAQINNLSQNANGVWVNQKGEIDEFANALDQSTSKINDAKDNYNRLIDAFENTPTMSLIFADDDFDIPREQVAKFADDFTAMMRDMKDNNSVTWDKIVAEVMEKTGMTKEETEKCLTDSSAFVKEQDAIVKSAVTVTFSNLATQLGLTEAQVAKAAIGIRDKLSTLANFAMATMNTVNAALGTKDNYYKILQTPVGNLLSPTATINTTLNNGKLKVPTSSGRLVEKSTAFGTTLEADIEEYKKRSEEVKKAKEKLKNANNEFEQEMSNTAGTIKQGDKRLQNIVKNNDSNRKGSGNSSPNGVPKVIEDKIEDLRHELEMGRISEEQFYKGVENLYKNNSGSLSKRGKQKFEKMLKDAKSKADNSMPPYVKVLVDDLEEQLKYGEIDQYTYSSKLDDLARRYKTQLGTKAIKEIEKKISDAKVGGLDKYFKAQIDEYENIIKVSDLAIKKIQAEQSLFEALNMGDTAGMSLQASKINVINNKLYITEALAKKYESVLKVINEEIKKLDTNSSSYKTTLQGLASKQSEFTNKLNETKISIIELQKLRVEEQMKVYDAMQKKYDDAVSTIEQIESKLVTYIQQRNQKIREQIDKNHQAKMDSIEKEAQARDKELEKEKKRLQDALEAYRKYTQGKIDALNKEAEEEDYNEELNKKMQERDELQYRINSLSLDDSSEGRAKRIELKKQLADKNNEIEKFQKERSRKLTQDGLQEQLKDYEDSIEQKQKKMDDNAKHERELLDNRKQMLEDEHKHELEILDEKMKASSVYAEAKTAILSGYVQDATGASITIRDAMIDGMKEQGHASGILAQKYINDLDAVIRKAKEAQQIMGMAKSSASAGSLQARLGLTDEGYQQYLGDKANYLGFSKDDTERYINNKVAWGSASASEKKRLSHENHLLRAKYAGAGNWNNKNFNKDINGEVLGLAWVEDTGSAMKVGQAGGQFTPFGGNFGREEARDTALADFGLLSSYTRGSSEAFFDNQMNQFKRGGYSYSQPTFADWTSRDYYNRYKEQSQFLDRFNRTPADKSDYVGALNYIRGYKEDLENNFDDSYMNQDYPYDSGDNSVREALMSAAKAQDGLPYSQGSNRYTTHRDCSSYVYYAVKNAGLYGGDGFYTGDMIPKLAQYGWQDLGHIPKEQIRRGDILWVRDGKRNHTEIATQDGTLNTTGAHSPSKPAGPSVWTYDYKVLRHPKVNGYSNGGVADYTGMAMLHGTKSSPEYIFNTPQFDALGRIIANYISAPAIYGKGVYNGADSIVPEINIDTLINIEGNADQNTVREIERRSDEILDNLIIGLKKRGIRK
ncbi:phage tail tape measure protein [Peptoniphilus sp. AGMB00490]|uniref:Phage tail tape measure protein n=1 Tax=Peptoniphilus faecalis TaxID=2731255 RepID=A0A848RA33_9FIRM|nr:phage tail tape measure protein [Peptoniphilus faecalis]NMW84678.1 phage tail tape measure protein [Peptoniphilus faecalis]